jgi:D-alanine-D-alanine ligase-like ATP-grasp enzyme
LEGYQLPSYDKAIEMVKRLHLKLPFFNLVGWDVAIQENGEPVLIEFNTNPGLSQSAFKSGMGEYTERIIRELWPRPNTWFLD